MSFLMTLVVLAVVAFVVLVVLIVFKSIHSIGADRGRAGHEAVRASSKLADDNPIAFHGEAGYQAELLMPGLRFKLWPIFG